MVQCVLWIGVVLSTNGCQMTLFIKSVKVNPLGLWICFRHLKSLLFLPLESIFAKISDHFHVSKTYSESQGVDFYRFFTILHALLIMIEGFIFSFVNIFHALLYLHFWYYFELGFYLSFGSSFHFDYLAVNDKRMHSGG